LELALLHRKGEPRALWSADIWGVRKSDSCYFGPSVTRAWLARSGKVAVLEVTLSHVRDGCGEVGSVYLIEALP